MRNKDITHEIFEVLDYNTPLGIRSAFSDTSKAFDKVWHEGLLYKLRSMCISLVSFMIFPETICQGNS